MHPIDNACAACDDCSINTERIANAPNEGNTKMATITAKELALLCDTDPKSMRRFIRAQAKAGDGSIIDACGQGNRYAIDASDANALVNAFKASNRSHSSNAPARSVDELRAMLAEAEAAETA
jgi:hypothetical protein